MKIYCQVTELGLVPMYDSDLDERKKLKLGSRVLCEIKRPRNYEFHKKFFALLRLTVDNLPESLHSVYHIYDTQDMLRSLKLDLGMAEIINVGGREVYCPTDSISFAAMDETDFQVFYNQCENLILNKYLRGTRREELIENIKHYF